MTRHILNQRFFKRSTLTVARELLGLSLFRRFDDGNIVSAEIVEVEAYTADDPACHAYKGLTKRTSVMFGPPGYAYVYFIYGMYHCLNVVTEPDGIAGAVLIRAISSDKANGPGKLCKRLQITNEHNGINLLDNTGELWLGYNKSYKDTEIISTTRIGISQAQDRLWRYYVKDNPYVSTYKTNAKNKKPILIK
jgi:DNA-3-methyladenine glycosylase